MTIAAVALGIGLTVLAAAPRIPVLRQAERAFTAWLAATTRSTDFEVTGSGDYDDPWTLSHDAPPATPPEPPRFLSITDDPAGIFESNPPSASDWAVILANLHHQGHRSLAVVPVLAWTDPDPIAAAAVDSQLERFRPAITGMPVVRGISPQPIPPAFQRFSLPLTAIRGDHLSLPIVNQPAVANAALGRTQAVATFTRLESEAAPDFSDPTRPALVPLLARWDDRIVFSLPLAATMVHFSVRPGDLTIQPGKEIRLGKHGPVIPVDLHGRATIPPLKEPPPALPAENLIDPDRKPEALAPPDPAPWIVRDERSRLSPDDKETSRRVADVLVALAALPRGGHTVALPRPHPAAELSLLLALALLAGAAAGFRHPPVRAGAFAALLLASWIVLLLLARFSVWQPALATCATTIAATATAACQFVRHRRKAPAVLANPASDGAYPKNQETAPAPAPPPSPTTTPASAQDPIPTPAQPIPDTAVLPSAPEVEAPAPTPPPAARKTTRRKKAAEPASPPPAAESVPEEVTETAAKSTPPKSRKPTVATKKAAAKKTAAKTATPRKSTRKRSSDEIPPADPAG